jgi:hypothetical protein
MPLVLADLYICAHDLDLAAELLVRLEKVAPEPLEPDTYITSVGLWTAALVKFTRCFESSRAKRQPLTPAIFKGAGDAAQAFEYFKKVRNMHVAHDYNPMGQCKMGIIVSLESRVVGLGQVQAHFSPDQQHVSKLLALVRLTHERVEELIQRQKAAVLLYAERLPLDHLRRRPQLEIETPGREHVDANRVS